MTRKRARGIEPRPRCSKLLLDMGVSVGGVGRAWGGAGTRCGEARGAAKERARGIEPRSCGSKPLLGMGVSISGARPGVLGAGVESDSAGLGSEGCDEKARTRNRTAALRFQTFAGHGREHGWGCACLGRGWSMMRGSVRWVRRTSTQEESNRDLVVPSLYGAWAWAWVGLGVPGAGLGNNGVKLGRGGR